MVSDLLLRKQLVVSLYGIGLWLSSQVTDEIGVQNAAQMLGGPITFFSGKLYFYEMLSKLLLHT